MKASITPRTMLVILAALFLLPLALAWLMYTGVIDFQPESTRNKGILVSPPVPLEWRLAFPPETEVESSTTMDRLLKHWVVLYPVDETCDSVCERHLSSIRQVHLATGRHQDRIRLVVLFPGPPLADAAERIRNIYPEFIVAADTSGGLRRVIDTASSTVSLAGSTYLIDPLGNIMMVYPATADPNDLKEDLKRLLKWSKLDEQS